MIKLLLISILSIIQSTVILLPPVANYREKFISVFSDPDNFNIETLFNIGKALSQSDDIKKFDSVCKKIPAKFTSVQENYFSIKLNDLFNCQIPETDNEMIYATTQSNIDIGNLYYAISILRKNKYQMTKQIKSDLIEVIAKSFELSQKSLLDSSFAIKSLVALGGHKLGGEFSAIRSNIDLVQNTLKSSTEYDNNKLSIEDGNIQKASIIIRTIIELAKNVDEKLLSGCQVVKFSNFFIAASNNDENVNNLALIIQALSALNLDLTPIPKPVKFTKSGQYPNFSFLMTDVFGNQVDSVRYEIKISDQFYAVGADGKIDLSGAKLNNGLHRADVSISGVESYAGIDESLTKFSFGKTFDEEFGVKNEEFVVVRKGSSVGSKIQGDLVIGDKLQLKFDLQNSKGEKLQAQQVFLKFSMGNRQGFQIVKYKSGQYSTIINLEREANKIFSGASGEWNVDIIVGDNGLKKGIVKSLTKISTKFDLEPKSVIADLVKANYSPKRLHEHTFNKEAARPPSSVSFIFTGVVLTPLLILLILWPIFGVNLKLFSLNLETLIFHISFGGILYLYAMYWLKLNAFQTLNYLAGLGLVLLLTGHKVLSNLANKRRNIDVKDKKKKL